MSVTTMSTPDPEGAAAALAGAPDPSVIAELANAFFQALPSQAVPPVSGGAALPSSQVPTNAPLLPTASALSYAPGLAPSGPGVSVLNPSLAPYDGSSGGGTPNLPGSPAQVPSSPAIPTGGLPASPDAPRSFLTDADFRDLPHSLAGVMSLVPRLPGSAPAIDLPLTVPGGTAAAPSDLPYFLNESRAAAARTEPAPQAPVEPDLSNVPTLVRPEALTLSPSLVPDLGPSARPFDPRSVRRDFPILQTHVHGRPLIWLDNAATTQKPRAVIDRLSYFYENENSNIHRAAHALAARATDAYEAAREKVRRFLGAGSSKEIIFVRGATEGINLVAQSWGRRNVKEGDEIVITWLEHHANIVPWQQLCAEKGAKLCVAPVDDTGQIILEEYEKLINPRTRLVSFTQVSNALGTVTPAREMVAIARRHGARVLVDGAQAVSHLRIDVQSLDPDFYVFSGHKVFAPTGIGVVYGKSEVLEHMPPWQGGGNMIADVTFEKTIYQGAPDRFEAGTGNIADAVGLGAAIDYLDTIGMENITRYEHELLLYATQGLKSVPGLKLIGTAAEKTSVLSFVLDGIRSEDVGAALDREGIAVRSGHHCAQPILRRFGLESTVRPSLAFYNTCEDIDALVAALLRLRANRI